jgi:hypothetical protein
VKAVQENVAEQEAEQGAIAITEQENVKEATQKHEQESKKPSN